ncbi:hypothetical protein V1294_006345 [Bradyrhizobium sp. AZCC 1678]|jgi:hypothetical protein|uniref:hypothetical protein n=1 Tax=Bradyrhizobium sp. AZCC 1678 TaxID=3117030 RepID=UPI002FEE953C
MIDGVPLPSDATVATTKPGNAFQQWSGVWVGVWLGSPKHILLVESIGDDGTARVVYAIGDNFSSQPGANGYFVPPPPSWIILLR